MFTEAFVVVSGQEDEEDDIDDEEMGIYVSGRSPSRKRMPGTDESDDSRLFVDNTYSSVFSHFGGFMLKYMLSLYFG